MEPRRPSTQRDSARRDDESQFWERWPRASRYFPPEQRQRYEREYPGWYPGCDLSGIVSRNQVQEPRAAPEFARLMKLQRELCGQGATPAQVIVALEPHFDSIGPYAQAELKAHLADLYQFGEEWPIRHESETNAWLFQNGQRVFMTGVVYPLFGRTESASDHRAPVTNG